MSDIFVGCGALRGAVNIPASKSYGHRLLIESLISGNRVTVKGNLQGDDIEATIGCMEAIGVRTERSPEGITVIPPDRLNRTATLDANESGSTLRFFMSLAPILGVEATFTGRGELPKRPVDSILAALAGVGITHSNNRLPLTLSGSIYPEPRFKLSNLKSSQEVSGILMAIPDVEGATLEVDGILPSTGYVDITLETLKKFGVEYVVEGGVFTPVKGYAHDVVEVFAEGDWSGAAFMIAAGVLTGETEVKGLKYPSMQPDSVVVELLQRAGADIAIRGGTVHSRKSSLNAIEFDADGCPDLVPIMAVTLAFAKGTSVITGVDRLRFKETDRIAAVIELLAAFKIKARYADGALYIDGGVPVGGGKAQSKGDHRIAMSAAICAAAAEGGVVIENAACVSKSYADFYRDLVKLGGRVYER